MIVKNETRVLPRLFNSLIGVIDRYCISDTGSTDGTPQLIKEWMDAHGIPGEVHHDEWVNFGLNRQRALDHAIKLCNSPGYTGNWALIIDADEELIKEDVAAFRGLEVGKTYMIEKRNGGLSYEVPNILDIRMNKWHWREPLHEYLEHIEGPQALGKIVGAYIKFYVNEGGRSLGRTSEEKYLADAEVLANEIKKNGDSPRHWFYLAQCYRDAGHLEKAYHAYKKRVELRNGWAEEGYHSQYQMGILAVLLQKPHAVIMSDFFKAATMRPIRGEALHSLAMYLRNQGKPNEAYMFAAAGALLPTPQDKLFLEKDVYEWKLLDELGAAAWGCGLWEIAQDASIQMLQRHASGLANIPAEDIARIKNNIESFRGGSK
jgi:glycosyltransferase involved in cell wall biosynthesis